MFDVSVACVRLRWLVLKVRVISDIKILLRVEVEMRTIDLIESPEQVFRGAVDIVAARGVRKVVAQWRSRELRFEEVDLVEEQDDTGPHEPSAVDN
jgi:hypothetical protein